MRIKLKSPGFVVICMILGFSQLFCQNRIKQLDVLILDAYRNKEFNGVVLIAEQDEIIYEKAVGKANMEWDVPHNMNSKFKIASLSKQFTCMLILQLVDEGRIALDAKIIDYLPDYPAKQGAKVTIRDLMRHSSGIPNFSDFENWYSELWVKEYSNEEFLALFKTRDLEFEPGSQFNYSNSGYRILATIIEKICGQPFDQVMKERIFQVLGMKDSGCLDINTIVPQMSSAYEYWQLKFTRSDYSSPTTVLGAGSVYSTAHDLWKWHQALTGSRLISSRLTDQMLRTQIDAHYNFGYGFGLIIEQAEIAGEMYNLIGHTGAYPGFNTLYGWFPEKEILIIMLNNTGHTKLKFFRDEIMKILLAVDE